MRAESGRHVRSKRRTGKKRPRPDARRPELPTPDRGFQSGGVLSEGSKIKKHKNHKRAAKWIRGSFLGEQQAKVHACMKKPWDIPISYTSGKHMTK